MSRAFLVAAVLLALAGPAAAKVVNENRDDLPPGCDGVSGEVSFRVKAGRVYAQEFPGAVFSFDTRDFRVEACTRVTVTFVNEDDIRHQFMVHGTWPSGFFQIELDGEGEESGTFIADADDRTRLIHCGLPQHQQKGMKAQLVVGNGEGTIPNILGISGVPQEDRWWSESAGPVVETPFGPFAAAFALGAAAWSLGRRH